jgi:hypothetical protein
MKTIRTISICEAFLFVISTCIAAGVVRGAKAAQQRPAKSGQVSANWWGPGIRIPKQLSITAIVPSR